MRGSDTLGDTPTVLEPEDRARKVALITGAASGIGAAIATLLSEHRWKVAGLDLRGSKTDSSLV
jgi:NAD(P)-dependent dehydrogenase (short-subunit alcohol dehydrogenase family)